jgi:hypothetical protein
MRTRAWLVLPTLAAIAACDVAVGPGSWPGSSGLASSPAGGPGPAPAPDPAPALAPAPTTSPAPPPPRRPGAYANVDPDDDLIVAPPDPVPDCTDQLDRAGIRYKASSLPVHQDRRSKIVCGAPQVVVYQRGPGNVAYEPAPLLTCTMALALASFERVLQDEATRTLGSRVVRVEQLGTYSCRQIVAYPGWVSEHSYANAIDLARFVLQNGAAVSVERDFDMGVDAPRRPTGAFLRAVSQRAFDEDVFSHVLTPFFNAAHRNHFHLDLARYRGDGTRPESS